MLVGWETPVQIHVYAYEKPAVECGRQRFTTKYVFASSVFASVQPRTFTMVTKIVPIGYETVVNHVRNHSFPSIRKSRCMCPTR